MAYVVTAPCVVVRDTTGSLRYCYAGSPLPDGLPAEEIERQVQMGLVKEVAALTEDVDPTTAVGTATTTPESDPAVGDTAGSTAKADPAVVKAATDAAAAEAAASIEAAAAAAAAETAAKTAAAKARK